MVIIPLSGRMSIKNPPFVTIALILVNCIVFFAFLSPDTKLYREAGEYYVGSDLALIEAKALRAVPEVRQGDEPYAHRGERQPLLTPRRSSTPS